MLSTCGAISPLEFSSSPNPPYKKPRAQQWDAACPVTDPIRQIRKAGGSQSAAGESRVPTAPRGWGHAVERRGQRRGIPSTHHRHHHRLLCHPPVGDHGPLRPGVGKRYWVMRSQKYSSDLATSPSAVWNSPGAVLTPRTPQLPLRSHFPGSPLTSMHHYLNLQLSTPVTPGQDLGQPHNWIPAAPSHWQCETLNHCFYPKPLFHSSSFSKSSTDSGAGPSLASFCPQACAQVCACAQTYCRCRSISVVLLPPTQFRASRGLGVLCKGL